MNVSARHVDFTALRRGGAATGGNGLRSGPATGKATPASHPDEVNEAVFTFVSG